MVRAVVKMPHMRSSRFRTGAGLGRGNHAWWMTQRAVAGSTGTGGELRWGSVLRRSRIWRSLRPPLRYQS